MKPKHVEIGCIDSRDFEWGNDLDEIDLTTVLDKITTKKAEMLLAEALGEYCGDGPLVFFSGKDHPNSGVKINHPLDIQFCFWLAEDPPFTCTYNLDDMLEDSFAIWGDGPAVLKSLKKLIQKYESKIKGGAK